MKWVLLFSSHPFYREWKWVTERLIAWARTFSPAKILTRAHWSLTMRLIITILASGHMKLLQCFLKNLRLFSLLASYMPILLPIHSPTPQPNFVFPRAPFPLSILQDSGQGLLPLLRVTLNVPSHKPDMSTAGALVHLPHWAGPKLPRHRHAHNAWDPAGALSLLWNE